MTLPPFRSAYRDLYDDLVKISPSVPNAVARAIAYEDAHDLSIPRVYVSTAITSAGYRRDPALPIADVIERNNNAALLIAAALQDHDAPNVAPDEIMLPVELGSVQGWKDSDYLLFYFSWLAGLTETATVWLVDELATPAYGEIINLTDDRTLSNEERWPHYRLYTEALLTKIAVAESRPCGKRADGADLMLQLIDVEWSLGCRAERIFADARGLIRLAPTFDTDPGHEALAHAIDELIALGAVVGLSRKPVELVPAGPLP